MKNLIPKTAPILAFSALFLLTLAAFPGLLPAVAPAHPAAARQASSTAHKSAQPADLPLIDLAGYQHALAKYRGKPVLVSFWATWCEPCRDEFPMVTQLARQYAPQGLAVFGVSLDDDADIHLVRRFLAKNQPPFPNYRQKPGIDVDAFYHGVNPAWTGTMPETIFYGRDGRIVGHFVGEQPREAFEQGIHMILGTSASSGSSR
ncbi:MAG TPA: TlpA disulfide reductase family protein [Candidatus Limnocylindrales bacterium]|nr:TlpA disulfide reductase family protein [Candidatus Limnocylindrales bacterium]